MEGDDDPAFPPIARAFWASCYRRITRALPLGFERDWDARDFVDEMLRLGHHDFKVPPVKNLAGKTTRFGTARGEHATPGTARYLGTRNVMILAPGPGLDDFIERHVVPARKPNADDTREKCSEPTRQGNLAMMAVDGATKALLERGIVPDIIITDLDGMRPGDFSMVPDDKEFLVIIHCHGDNLDALEMIFEKGTLCRGVYAIFTTQVEPTPRVFNWGGFTDGDRAIFAAFQLGFTRLGLGGMELDDPIGPRSKEQYRALPDEERDPRFHPVKAKKLRIARRVLEWAWRNRPAGVEIFTIGAKQYYEFLPFETAFPVHPVGQGHPGRPSLC